MDPEYFVVESDEEELSEYEQLRKRNIEEIRKKLSEHMANQPKFPAVPTRQPGPVRKAKKKVKKVKRPTPIFQCFIVLKDIGKNMPTTVGEEESLQRIQEKAKRRLDNVQKFRITNLLVRKLMDPKEDFILSRPN